ncbi:MAG: D-alanine--D-alanine ligase [Oscillospiraceae bacterium]|nr:D-alanine--D-alanine ligase [Oscillospiraceae bacterium]
MARLRLLVLFGGSSCEYSASLAMTASILRVLPADKYEIVPVGINKKNRWLYFPGDIQEIESDTWSDNQDCMPAVLSPDPAHSGILILEDGTYTLKRIDVVFSMLKGKYGEDGSIQGLCELSNIPYVGNQILGSAVCRNKALTHKLLSEANIPMPHWVSVSQRHLNRLDREYERIEEQLEYPIYVKPSRSSASAVSGIAENREQLAALVKRAFTKDNTVLAEELVEGRELRVGVFGYDLPFSSFVGEIIHDNGKAVTVPADLDDTISKIVRDYAILAYQTLECASLALFDFFYTEQGGILLGEVNTLPDLSEDAIYPMLMSDLGMRYSYLIEKLIEQAVEHSDRGL